jgi:hypothetical protein
VKKLGLLVAGIVTGTVAWLPVHIAADHHTDQPAPVVHTALHVDYPAQTGK